MSLLLLSYRRQPRSGDLRNPIIKSILSVYPSSKRVLHFQQKHCQLHPFVFVTNGHQEQHRGVDADQRRPRGVHQPMRSVEQNRVDDPRDQDGPPDRAPDKDLRNQRGNHGEQVDRHGVGAGQGMAVLLGPHGRLARALTDQRTPQQIPPKGTRKAQRVDVFQVVTEWTARHVQRPFVQRFLGRDAAIVPVVGVTQSAQQNDVSGHQGDHIQEGGEIK